MRVWVLATFLLAAAQLGCSTAPPPPTEHGECAFAGRGAFVLWLEPIDVQPGESVPLRVLWRDELGGFTEAPAQCVTHWAIDDPRVAVLSPDRTALIVQSDAESGATTEVTANIGARSVSGQLHVFRRADQPLVGLWRQDAAACADGRPIAELVFSADGSYSATWVPFETYKDYWGLWRFDAATGSLDLSVEGGNYMPADVRSGRIVLTGDSFELGSASFGSSREGGRCAASFHRAR